MNYRSEPDNLTDLDYPASGRSIRNTDHYYQARIYSRIQSSSTLMTSDTITFITSEQIPRICDSGFQNCLKGSVYGIQSDWVLVDDPKNISRLHIWFWTMWILNVPDQKSTIFSARCEFLVVHLTNPTPTYLPLTPDLKTLGFSDMFHVFSGV